MNLLLRDELKNVKHRYLKFDSNKCIEVILWVPYTGFDDSTTERQTTEWLTTERLTTEWLTTEQLMTERLSDWTTNDRTSNGMRLND